MQDINCAVLAIYKVVLSGNGIGKGLRTSSGGLVAGIDLQHGSPRQIRPLCTAADDEANRVAFDCVAAIFRYWLERLFFGQQNGTGLCQRQRHVQLNLVPAEQIFGTIQAVAVSIDIGAGGRRVPEHVRRGYSVGLWSAAFGRLCWQLQRELRKCGHSGFLLRFDM